MSVPELSHSLRHASVWDRRWDFARTVAHLTDKSSESLLNWRAFIRNSKIGCLDLWYVFFEIVATNENEGTFQYGLFCFDR
jgi:hypothetical protein